MVILGRDAKATILVCDHTLSDDSFLSNNTTEVVVGENAAFEYYHVQNQHIEASQINSVFVSQKRNSRYDANVITLYGGFIRNNLFAALTEEGCESNLYGMYLSDKNNRWTTSPLSTILHLIVQVINISKACWTMRHWLILPDGLSCVPMLKNGGLSSEQ